MSFPQRLFLITLLSISIPLVASSQSIDSLKRELKAAKSEDDQFKLLQQLAHAMMQEGDTNSIPYYNRIIKLATKRNDQGILANAYKEIGVLWFYTSEDYKRSSEAYYKGLEALKDTNSFYSIRAQLYGNIGWNFKRLVDFKKALEFYVKAEHQAKLSKDDQIISNILNNKGVVEKDLRLYDSALKTLTKSLQLSRKIGNKRLERFTLNNISVNLIELNRFAEASDTLQKVMAMNRIARDTTEIINNLLNINIIYNRTGNYNKSIETLLDALALTSPQELSLQSRIYSEIENAYAAKGDFKNAYLYLDRYRVAWDSLDKFRYDEQTLELDAKYNSAVKDRDLEEAKKNLAEQQLYITLILSMLALVVVAAIFLWRLYTVKKINEKTLLRLNNEIEAQAEELRQSNNSIKAINENLESLVAERTLVIKEQNYRLLQFTFMNAHKIRGPIASLIGLMDMLQRDPDPELQKTLTTHMKTSIDNLDVIVRETTQKLEQEGLTPNGNSEGS